MNPYAVADGTGLSRPPSAAVGAAVAGAAGLVLLGGGVASADDGGAVDVGGPASTRSADDPSELGHDAFESSDTFGAPGSDVDVSAADDPERSSVATSPEVSGSSSSPPELHGAASRLSASSSAAAVQRADPLEPVRPAMVTGPPRQVALAVPIPEPTPQVADPSAVPARGSTAAEPGGESGTVAGGDRSLHAGSPAERLGGLVRPEAAVELRPIGPAVENAAAEVLQQEFPLESEYLSDGAPDGHSDVVVPRGGVTHDGIFSPVEKDGVIRLTPSTGRDRPRSDTGQGDAGEGYAVSSASVPSTVDDVVPAAEPAGRFDVPAASRAAAPTSTELALPPGGQASPHAGPPYGSATADRPGLRLGDGEGVLVAADLGGSDTPMDLGIRSTVPPAQPLGGDTVDASRIFDSAPRRMVEFTQGAGAELVDLILNGTYGSTAEVGEALRLLADHPEYLECGAPVSCVAASVGGVWTIVPGSAAVGAGFGQPPRNPLGSFDPASVPAGTTGLGLVTVKPPNFGPGGTYAHLLPGVEQSDLTWGRELSRAFPDTPVTATSVAAFSGDTAEFAVPPVGHYPQPGEIVISNPLGVPVADQFSIFGNLHDPSYPLITLAPGTTVAPPGTALGLFNSLHDPVATAAEATDRYNSDSALAMSDLELLDPTSHDEIDQALQEVGRRRYSYPVYTGAFRTPVPDPWDAEDPAPLEQQVFPAPSRQPPLPATPIRGLLPPAVEPVEESDGPSPVPGAVNEAIRAIATELGLSHPGEDAPPPVHGRPAVTYAVRPGTPDGSVRTSLRLYAVDGVPVGDPPAVDELSLQLDTGAEDRSPMFAVVGREQINLFDGGLWPGRSELDQQHRQITSDAPGFLDPAGAPLPARLPGGVTVAMDGPWTTPDPLDMTTRLWVGGRPTGWRLRDGETGWVDDGQVSLNLSFADGRCITFTCSGAATLTGAPRVLGDDPPFVENEQGFSVLADGTDGVGPTLVDLDGRAPVSFAPLGTVGWTVDPPQQFLSPDAPGVPDPSGSTSPNAGGGHGTESGTESGTGAGTGIFGPPQGFAPDFGADLVGTVYRPEAPDPEEQRRYLEGLRPRPQPPFEPTDVWVLPPATGSEEPWQEEWPAPPTPEEREAMQHTPPFPGAQPQAPPAGETQQERLWRMGVLTFGAELERGARRWAAPFLGDGRRDAPAGPGDGARPVETDGLAPAGGPLGWSPALVGQEVMKALSAPVSMRRLDDGTFEAAGGVPFTPSSYVARYGPEGELLAVGKGDPPQRVDTRQYMDPAQGLLVAGATRAPWLLSRAASVGSGGLGAGALGSGGLGAAAVVPPQVQRGVQGFVEEVGGQLWRAVTGSGRPSVALPGGAPAPRRDVRVGDGTSESTEAANRHSASSEVRTNHVGREQPTAADPGRPPGSSSASPGAGVPAVSAPRAAGGGSPEPAPVRNPPVVAQVQQQVAEVREAVEPAVAQVQQQVAQVQQRVAEAVQPVVAQVQDRVAEVTEAAQPAVRAVQDVAGKAMNWLTGER